jgi:hypothetical protein
MFEGFESTYEYSQVVAIEILAYPHQGRRFCSGKFEAPSRSMTEYPSESGELAEVEGLG